MIFWIFPIVPCRAFCMWQRFGFEFHLRSSPSAFCSDYMDISRPAEFFIQLATPCWRDPTRSKQLSTVAILGFQFGLYRVVAPLSFLRSINLASLFTSLSIFGWSDILRILRKQAAFLFAVLCTIMFTVPFFYIFSFFLQVSFLLSFS